MSILKRLRLLWEVFKNKQTPWVVRLILIAGFAYVLLPIDLIPDNMPVVGWMDDLALAIVLVAAALKFTPEELLAKLVAKMNQEDKDE
jgi:uncharacterized membrane protein YkvA (DUF1232 family)